MSSLIDPDEDPSLHRLEGSAGDQKGGLIIMKKGPSTNDDKFAFKKPSGSILGLDKLAAAKRKQDAGKSDSARKKSKVKSYKDYDDESDSDSDSSSSDDNDDDDDDERVKKKSRKDRLVKLS